MPTVVRQKLKYGLQVLLGDDGIYRLVVDDDVIFISRVMSAVDIEFDEVAEQRSAATREARSRELSDFAVRGVLAKAGQQKSAARNAGKSRGKGG